MQNHSKTKQIHKGSSFNQGQKKKPYRPQYNNNNPNNKLTLNKYHQIQTNQAHDNKKSQSFKLHKKKRDLQRIIKHCEQKGIPIDPVKKAELDKIQGEMGDRRKHYEKDKRKEFFLDQKYKDIKMIELRKVNKHLEATKANPTLKDNEKKKEIQEWEKKLRYINHFPKTLKYISLFPTTKPLEQKTLEFQKKIMDDIEEENSKRVARLNFYKSQNEVVPRKGPRGQENKQGENKKASIMPLTTRQFKTKQGKKTRQVVDDFFVQQQQESENEVEIEVEKVKKQKKKVQKVQEDESESQSQIDEQMQVGDEDDMQVEEEDQDQEDDE